MRRERFHPGSNNTVFVDNVPPNIDKFGLQGVFRNTGKIKEVSIPMKRSRITGRRFGFIEFWNRDDVDKAVQLMNRRRVRGFTITVKPRREFKNRQVWVRKEKWDRRRNGGDKQNEQENKEEERPVVVRGTTNQDLLEWLARSLVCISENPWNISTLVYTIHTEFGLCSKVTAISSTKFILTFENAGRVEEILKDQNEVEQLNQWFTEVRKWCKYEYAENRRIWIDVHGVPPHAWTWETFEDLLKPWGRVLSLGCQIREVESFEVMKVQILTDIFDKIRGQLTLTVEDLGYHVTVIEAESCYQQASRSLGARNPYQGNFQEESTQSEAHSHANQWNNNDESYPSLQQGWKSRSCSEMVQETQDIEIGRVEGEKIMSEENSKKSKSREINADNQPQFQEEDGAMFDAAHIGDERAANGQNQLGTGAQARAKDALTEEGIPEEGDVQLTILGGNDGAVNYLGSLNNNVVGNCQSNLDDSELFSVPLEESDTLKTTTQNKPQELHVDSPQSINSREVAKRISEAEKIIGDAIGVRFLEEVEVSVKRGRGRPPKRTRGGKGPSNRKDRRRRT